MSASLAAVGLAGLATVLVAMTILWVVSLRLRDASIVDPFWAPGFALVTLAYLIADGRFASGVAARLAVRRGSPLLVDPGSSPEFCAPLPIGWLQTLGEVDAELADLDVAALGEVDHDAARQCVGDRHTGEARSGGVVVAVQ